MQPVILVIHLILALAIIAVVLLQRSEGGGLGIGGGGGGLGDLATARSTANVLTRMTAILAACFMGTSLLLAILAEANAPKASIMDVIEEQNAAVEGSAEAGAAGTATQAEDAAGAAGKAPVGDDADPEVPVTGDEPAAPISE